MATEGQTKQILVAVQLYIESTESGDTVQTNATLLYAAQTKAKTSHSFLKIFLLQQKKNALTPG